MKVMGAIWGFLVDYGGRITVGLAVAAEIAAAIWNVHLHQAIDLGPGGIGGGLAAIITAGAALLAAPPAVQAVALHQARKLQETKNAVRKTR